jgi:hypothetical protein
MSENAAMNPRRLTRQMARVRNLISDLAKTAIKAPPKQEACPT